MKALAQNKFLVILVGLLLLANLAILLFFVVLKKDGNKHDSSHKNPSEFVQKELGFDQQQTEKFKQLREQHVDSIRPYFESMRKLKDSLYGLLQKPATSDSQLSSITTSIGEKQKQIEEITFRHFQRVRALCTPEQLPKFDTLLHKIINRGPGMRKGSPPGKNTKDGH
jgi:protein CpxP